MQRINLGKICIKKYFHEFLNMQYELKSVRYMAHETFLDFDFGAY